MKKYHLADFFTALETICALVLLWMAITGQPAERALWTFVAGELCDALDGPCARRWHYPDDGKYRWWRAYNSEIDQISDILLAVTCGIYLIWRTNWIIGVALLGGIGSFCLLVQSHLYYYDSTRRTFRSHNYLYTDRLILFRRRFYVVTGLGGAIATLLWYTSYPFGLKLGVTLAAPVFVIIGVKLKPNRWSENKTPL